MNTKQDIYEHLAEIYLDASYKTKKNSKAHQWRVKDFFALGLAIISVPTIYLVTAINKPATTNSALVLASNVVKVQKYSINLDRRDLSRYRSLAFSVRKDGDHKKAVSLRVKLTSGQKEKSEIYLKPISYKWYDYAIDLRDFSNIADWSKMLNLSFTVEEMHPNAGEGTGAEGLVYLDNVRFLR